MEYAEYTQTRKELLRQLQDTLPGSPEEDNIREKIDRLDALKTQLNLEEPAPEPSQPPPESLRQSTAGRDYIEHVDGNVMITHYEKSSPNKDETSLGEVYLHRLLRQVSRLELSGIDRKAAGQNMDTCLNLSAIYTALLTLSSEHPEREQTKKVRDREMSLLGKQEQRLSALAQANQHHHLVLLGDPGSGKSTFVKFMAMCLAGELLENDSVNLALLTAPLPKEENEEEDDREKKKKPQQWNHGVLLPVVVILRDFAAKGLPPKGQPATAKHLWNFIVSTLEETMLGAYAPHLQEQLQKQGGLLLLDGLDEVPEAARRRTQIKQAVEDFTDLFPKCRILITSRTYAYQHQEWRLQGFAEAVLAPFTKAQIRFFVEHWYAHMAEVRGMNPDDARGRAELLKHVIFHSHRLFDFAQRPLLLTLMASLHAWRGGSLPQKRGELYAEATDLLLDWWEQAKIVKNPDGQTIIAQPCLAEVLQVGQERIFQVLTGLAFQAHNSQPDLEGTANIPEDTLVSALFTASENKDLRPGRLIEFLSDRAGLLVSHGNNMYTFPHRTFQEYLAACYLTEEDIEEESYPENAAILIRRDPNRWREVVLLAAAKASSGSSRMSWLVVDAFCEWQPDAPDITVEDAWSALLAGQALVETANLQQVSPRNRRKVERIRNWLVAILTEQVPLNAPFPPVERALAGNILNQLHDLRSGVGLQEDGLPDIEWCEVSAGSFLMGSDPKKDEGAFDDEQPQHTVQVSAFQISRYPVTNAQYQSFVDHGGYTEQWRECWSQEGWAWRKEAQISKPRSYGGEFDLPNHPIVGVSWYEASAFCRWLTLRFRESGGLLENREIRLPTEAEWEKAARGEDGRMYPWGDEISPELANYSETAFGVTSTVGCFPRSTSPYSCEEMAGNVYEWCLDWYDGKYYAQSPEKDPPGPASGSLRVVRGGYWNDDAGCVRAAYRFRCAPDYRLNVIGFRLVRTPS